MAAGRRRPSPPPKQDLRDFRSVKRKHPLDERRVDLAFDERTVAEDVLVQRPGGVDAVDPQFRQGTLHGADRLGPSYFFALVTLQQATAALVLHRSNK